MSCRADRVWVVNLFLGLFSIAALAGDLDGDGMNDLWERQYRLEPSRGDDAETDLDGDSFSNLCECLHGSEPDSRHSQPLCPITIQVPADLPTLRQAIAACIEGDRIVLAPGTYYEAVELLGRVIHLSSVDPNDPAVVAATIIDANDRRRDAVTVKGRATGGNSVLVEGLTLTGGRCGIRTRNLWASHGITFSKCRIMGNHLFGAFGYGDVRLQNCILARNGRRAIHVSRRQGSYEVVNCTVVNNGRYGIAGKGIDRITNSIIWGNGNDLHHCKATYSCIEDMDAGEGNLHRNPQFTDAAEDDFHLHILSPCVNAGDPDSDYSQEPSHGDARINMGAYGNTPQATLVDGGSVQSYTLAITAEHGHVVRSPDKARYAHGDQVSLSVEPDAGFCFRMWSGDISSLSNPMTVTVVGHTTLTANLTWPCYVSPQGDDTWDGTSPTYEGNAIGPKKTIGAAVVWAGDASIIKLAPGRYCEQVNFQGKDIMLTGFYPNDWDGVADTVICGSQAGPALTFSSGEGPTVVLQGLSIQNTSDVQAGIWCSNGSSPLVRRCIIEHNHDGIRCDVASPIVQHCIIRENSGAGLVADVAQPAIYDSIIHDNAVGLTIGGAASLVNVTIAHNTQGVNCQEITFPTLTNCIVHANLEGNTWGSATVTHSCIEGGYAGEGNLDDAPLLTQGFRLKLGSPCINRGLARTDGTYDIDGQARIMSTGIDMGAHEVAIRRIYVNAVAPPGGNGSSWSEAYGDLQDALSAAESGNHVWVAHGTYLPASTGDRTQTFQLKPDVQLVGGFAGHERRAGDRDWFGYPTILSGNIDSVGSLDSFHVVTGADNAVVDGFVITGGNANGVGIDGKGGGVLNLTASPMLKNCVLMANRALDQGGGLYSENSTASVLLSSCDIIFNTAGNAGGGLYNSDANSILTNCIVWGNTADTGPSVVNAGSSKNVASYSDIQGAGGSTHWDSSLGMDGGHNIDADPQFVDFDGADNIPGTADDDYAPGGDSPCITGGIRGQSMGAVSWEDVQEIGQASVLDPVDLFVYDERIYVLSSSDPAISVFDDQLLLQTSLFNGGVLAFEALGPRGMCLDGEGRIYIADTGNHRIFRVTPQGFLDPDFGQEGIVGAQGHDPGQFEAPSAVQVDGDGRVYVADTGNHRVQVFDSNGISLTLWGEQGAEPGHFLFPRGLTLYEMPETTLLIADTDNGRLQWLFGISGEPIDVCAGSGEEENPLSSPGDVWCDTSRDRVYVADAVNSRIQVLDLLAQGLGLCTDIRLPGLAAPSALVSMSTKGHAELVIADTGNNRILKVSIANDLPAQHPLYIHEEFKNAMRGADIGTAIQFLTEMSRKEYEVILQNLQPYSEQFINGMGPLELEYQTENTALYEMIHAGEGGVVSAFPVYFIKDKDGNWKIGTF